MAKYRVIGPYTYLDYAPGEEFVAELDPEMAARAIRIGSIKVIDSQRVALNPESVVEPKKARARRAVALTEKTTEEP